MLFYIPNRSDYAKAFMQRTFVELQELVAREGDGDAIQTCPCIVNYYPPLKARPTWISSAIESIRRLFLK